MEPLMGRLQPNQHPGQLATGRPTADTGKPSNPSPFATSLRIGCLPMIAKTTVHSQCVTLTMLFLSAPGKCSMNIVAANKEIAE
jgi:hypothetical protein